MTITAVMLHWARPENVQRIVREWLTNPLIDEYIVVSNSGTIPQLGDKVTYVLANRDLGLTSRFLAVLAARNKCVLLQDDDILLPCTTVTSLVRHWTFRPNLLHGIFGRHPKADGSYATLLDKREAKIDVVLSRALITSTDNAAHFFEHRSSFPMLNDSEVAGAGSDIVFSYVTKAYSGKQNEIHEVDYKELPAPQALTYRVSGYSDHRSRVMTAAHYWCQHHLKQKQRQEQALALLTESEQEAARKVKSRKKASRSSG